MAARKETRSIADFVADVAYRKHRAAQARFAGTQPGVETPRDVFLAACASIGAHLEESFGFKYAKSGPHSGRKAGDFTFQISFDSSHNNIAGEHVNLSICGTVLSARIKKWREAHSFLRAWEVIAGGQIGNLQVKPCWLDWELADPHNRDETIRDAIKAIDELALPWFARFEELPSLFEYLLDRELPGMAIERAVEFLMCFADQTKARLAAANYLKRRPDLAEDYQREFKHYAKGGLKWDHPSGYPKLFGFMSHAFKFGNLIDRGE